MHFYAILLTSFQMILVGGIGGIPLMAYATSGLFLKKEPPSETLAFTSEYHELMWLASRARGGLTEGEMLRFYELRDRWPTMHSDVPGELTAENRA